MSMALTFANNMQLQKEMKLRTRVYTYYMADAPCINSKNWKALSITYDSKYGSYRSSEIRELEKVISAASNGQSVDKAATLLHWAARCDTPWPISKFLEDEHVNVLAKDASGKTAYDVAIFQRNMKAIKVFENHFKEMNTLFFAAQHGQVEFLAFLITHYQHNFTEERDGLGNTVLLRAAENNHLETVRWLLDHGSSLSEQNNNGDCVHTLLKSGYKELLFDFAIGNDLTLPHLNGIDVSGCVFIGTLVSYTLGISGWKRTNNSANNGLFLKYHHITRDILREMGAQNYQESITNFEEWTEAFRAGKLQTDNIRKQLTKLKEIELSITNEHPAFKHFQALENLDEFISLLKNFLNSNKQLLLDTVETAIQDKLTIEEVPEKPAKQLTLGPEVPGNSQQELDLLYATLAQAEKIRDGDARSVMSFYTEKSITPSQFYSTDPEEIAAMLQSCIQHHMKGYVDVNPGIKRKKEYVTIKLDTEDLDAALKNEALRLTLLNLLPENSYTIDTSVIRILWSVLKDEHARHFSKEFLEQENRLLCLQQKEMKASQQNVAGLATLIVNLETTVISGFDAARRASEEQKASLNARLNAVTTVLMPHPSPS